MEQGRVVFDQPVALPEGTMVRVEPFSPVPQVIPGTGDWATVVGALSELANYDFDAWRELRSLEVTRTAKG